MEIIIYGLIFIIGTLFGSFSTLAVYRIPIGEDIIYKHSFCPNCGAKLKFKDLIPVISYIALGGKCAYCKQKIRIRYFLLEILSGIVFLLFALSLKANIFNINTNLVIYFLLSLLYIVSLFIIAGIDKERIQIQKGVLIFGIILSFIYMTYVCIQNNQIIYTYIIYLVSIIILFILDTAFLKKNMYQSYIAKVLILILYMVMFSGAFLSYITIIVTLLCISLTIIIRSIRNRKSGIKIKTEKKKISIGFWLCVFNIILMIFYNFFCNWVIV